MTGSKLVQTGKDRFDLLSPRSLRLKAQNGMRADGISFSSTSKWPGWLTLSTISAREFLQINLVGNETKHNKTMDEKQKTTSSKPRKTENLARLTYPHAESRMQKNRGKGHLWIVFYKSYPTLFALSHPFKPLVDYRLLCSQYNTGKTLEPACQRGLLLALKISIFGQLCLFPTGRIWSCAAMKSQIYI